MDDRQLLLEIRNSVDRLADEIDDQPEVAAALRRLADHLPLTRGSRGLRVADGRPFWRGPEMGIDASLSSTGRSRGRYWPPPETSLSESSSSSGVISPELGGLTSSRAGP